MSAFQWTPRREAAANTLAQGYTVVEAASQAGVNERTVRRWAGNVEFRSEVDRLSLMVNISSRAERLRMAMRVARQRVREDGIVVSEKDLLEWLKFAQSETDGAKLDLAAVFAAMETTAGSRSQPATANADAGAPVH